jgi:hypothetical protein
MTSTGTSTLSSNASDAIINSAVPAIAIKANNALTAGDLLLAVQNSTPTNLLTVTQEGNVAIAGTLTVTGDVTFNGGAGSNVALLGTAQTFTALNTFNADPVGSGVGQGSLYINPTTAAANETLLGVASNSVSAFRVDNEGDTFTAGSATVAGNILMSGATQNVIGMGTQLANPGVGSVGARILVYNTSGTTSMAAGDHAIGAASGQLWYNVGSAYLGRRFVRSVIRTESYRRTISSSVTVQSTPIYRPA